MQKTTLQDMEAQAPNPLPGTILRVLVAMSFIAIIGLFIGKVDIVAEAPGKLIPKSFLKVVQPFDSGIVNQVLVTEGQLVKKGDTLVLLDPVVAKADLQSIELDQSEMQMRLRRIQAELNKQPLIKQSSDNDALFDRTYSQYLARTQAHQAQLSQEQEGLNKLQADLDAANQIKLKLQSVLPLYQQEVKDFEDLVRAGARPQTELSQKQRDLTEKDRELQAHLYTIKGIQAAIEQAKRKLDQVNADYAKELRQDQADTQAKLDKVLQENIKQTHKTKLLELIAPADGIIKDLAIHSPGTVVSPGSVVLTLIPKEDALLAEVWLKNEDAGFVNVDQSVQVKIAAYPFQKYGLINGKILAISPDSSESTNSTSSASTSVNTQQSASNQPPMGQFKVLVSLSEQSLKAQGKEFPLKTGMQVVGEIHEGTRTVFEYFTAPVKKAVQEAARER